MTASKPHMPACRLHKARGLAVVTLGGRNYYLGAYGSPVSEARYNRLVSEYLRGDLAPAGPRQGPYLVGQLCDEILR